MAATRAAGSPSCGPVPGGRATVRVPWLDQLPTGWTAHMVAAGPLRRSDIGFSVDIWEWTVVVGLATIVMTVPEAASLKDKRRVVRSVRDRVRARFNVAVAEVATQEMWDTVTLGVACVSNDAAHAHSMLQKVVNFVERQRFDAALADYRIEIL